MNATAAINKWKAESQRMFYTSSSPPAFLFVCMCACVYILGAYLCLLQNMHKADVLVWVSRNARE
jgi:hypothetical protein